MTYWREELERVKKGEVRNYTLNFYRGDPVNISPQNAAKVKFAVDNDIKCFEINESIYMTSNVASLTKGKPPVLLYGSQIATKGERERIRAYSKALNMSTYLKDGKLLHSPKTT